jgi:uncharacterized membrane protein YbhN (UPF0104 family)
LVIVLGFVAVAVRRNWDAVQEDFESIGWGSMLASAAFGAAAVTLAGLSWRRALTALGHSIPPHDSLTIFFTSQLGKYVPGSVWPVVIQARLGDRHGVPKTTMSASYLAAFALSIGSGGVAGVFALAAADQPGVIALTAAGAIGAVVLAWLLLHPRGLHRLGKKLADRFGKTLPQVHLGAAATRRVGVMSFAVWCLFGVHAWFLAEPLGAGAADLPELIGAFALAFIAGLVVIPLPAGAGVREAVLVLILAGTVGRSGAITVALLSRFVLIIVELLLAAAFGVPSTIRRARAAGLSPVDPPA